MLQLTDKKNRLYIYLIFFILLSTVSNKSLQNKKNFSIIVNKIDVTGLSSKNNLMIQESLNELLSKNIFSINKEEIKTMISEHNLIEKYYIKKIYPTNIKIEIEQTKFVAKIIGDNSYLIGANGKLISKEKTNKKLPIFFGKFNSLHFLEFQDLIKKSEFEFSDIKSIYLFPSKRWDLKTQNNILIKLPEKNVSNALRVGYKIINDDQFKHNTIIDLRIPNNIIIQNE